MKTLLPLREANLLRKRAREVVSFRESFMTGSNGETVHDLRVASRRLREILDYLEVSLPSKWHTPMKRLTRRVTRILGPMREAEVNLEILRNWHKERHTDPAALELLMQGQKQLLTEAKRTARRRISHKRFEKYEKLILQIRGVREADPTRSPVLGTRKEQFVSFSWRGEMNDERLHDLRIRSKKLRYALEIHNILDRTKIDQLIENVKRLQEILGSIHDLSVLAAGIQEEKEQWLKFGLSVIPVSIEEVHEYLIAQKQKLYPEVFPAYATVIQNAPAHLKFKAAGARKDLQTKVS